MTNGGCATAKVANCFKNKKLFVFKGGFFKRSVAKQTRSERQHAPTSKGNSEKKKPTSIADQRKQNSNAQANAVALHFGMLVVGLTFCFWGQIAETEYVTGIKE